jgi:hypothetical protein
MSFERRLGRSGCNYGVAVVVCCWLETMKSVTHPLKK